jgi:hypothetical protein
MEYTTRFLVTVEHDTNKWSDKQKFESATQAVAHLLAHISPEERADLLKNYCMACLS